jgi:hypothetical protein
MKKTTLITGLAALNLVLLVGCDTRSESRKRAGAWIKQYTEGPSTPEGRKKAEEWIKSLNLQQDRNVR